MADIQSKMASAAARAAHLRQNLMRSYAATENMCKVLDAFDSRTEELEQIMLPIQSVVQFLSRGQESLDGVLEICEGTLRQFDVSRQVEAQIHEGPRGDFTSYFHLMDKLNQAVVQLSKYESALTEAALRHARDLQDKARVKCGSGFKDLLLQHMRPPEQVASHAIALIRPLIQDMDLISAVDSPSTPLPPSLATNDSPSRMSESSQLELVQPFVVPQVTPLCNGTSV
jgi:hypothetical protein